MCIFSSSAISIALITSILCLWKRAQNLCTNSVQYTEKLVVQVVCLIARCKLQVNSDNVVNLHHATFSRNDLIVVGKLITAAYVPVPNYHALFPDSAQATTLVMPSSSRVQTATQSLYMPA